MKTARHGRRRPWPRSGSRPRRSSCPEPAPPLPAPHCPVIRPSAPDRAHRPSRAETGPHSTRRAAAAPRPSDRPGLAARRCPGTAGHCGERTALPRDKIPRETPADAPPFRRPSAPPRPRPHPPCRPPRRRLAYPTVAEKRGRSPRHYGEMAAPAKACPWCWC